MWTPTLLALLLLAAPAPGAGRGHEPLMDEIEQALVLPQGAASLAEYGRNYAFKGAGTVVATYLRPLAGPDAKSGCSEVLQDFSLRPCTQKEVEQSVRSEARRVASETPAGRRRWFNDYRRLPFIYDGGCLQVNIEYDVAAHRVVRASCNGYV